MSEELKTREEEIVKELQEIISQKDEPGKDEDEVSREAFAKMVELVWLKEVREGKKKNGKNDWIAYVYCSICVLVVFAFVMVGFLSGGLG